VSGMFSLCRSEAENYVNDTFLQRVITTLHSRKHMPSLYALYSSPDVPREAIINRCAELSKKHRQPDSRTLYWIPAFRAWDMSTIGNLSLALLWHIYRSLPQEILADEKIIYKLGKISVTLPSLTNGLYKAGGVYRHDFERHTTISTKAFPSEKKSSVSSIFSACEQITELAETFHSLSQHIGSAGGFDALVVPVTDIDLCLPEQAISLLFAIRTYICSESISVVISSDREVLKNYLISLYDNSLSEKQSYRMLQSLLDDWAYLPVPDVLKLSQSFDIPLVKEKKEEMAKQIIESGVVSVLSDPSMLHDVFNRFNSFIIREIKTYSVNEYTLVLLLFFLKAGDEKLFGKLAIHPSLVHLIRDLREMKRPQHPDVKCVSQNSESPGRHYFSLKRNESEHSYKGKTNGIFSREEQILLHNIFSAIPFSISDELIAGWIANVTPFI
jgi:hypothetical protein